LRIRDGEDGIASGAEDEGGIWRVPGMGRGDDAAGIGICCISAMVVHSRGGSVGDVVSLSWWSASVYLLYTRVFCRAPGAGQKAICE
jgi:hypothetical protein